MAHVAVLGRNSSRHLHNTREGQAIAIIELWLAQEEIDGLGHGAITS